MISNNKMGKDKIKTKNIMMGRQQLLPRPTVHGMAARTARETSAETGKQGTLP